MRTVMTLPKFRKKTVQENYMLVMGCVILTYSAQFLHSFAPNCTVLHSFGFRWTVRTMRTMLLPG